MWSGPRMVPAAVHEVTSDRHHTVNFLREQKQNTIVKKGKKGKKSKTCESPIRKSISRRGAYLAKSTGCQKGGSSHPKKGPPPSAIGGPLGNGVPTGWPWWTPAVDPGGGPRVHGRRPNGPPDKYPGLDATSRARNITTLQRTFCN